MTELKLVLFIGLVISFLGFSSFQISESVLWDLLIDVNLEKNPIQVNENPVVFGSIIDHASKPVSNATVSIRLDIESVTVKTNGTGYFMHEFDTIDVPGYYYVNVRGTSVENKIGLADTTLHVEGSVLVSSQSEYDLELINYTYYERLGPEQFQYDPIGLKLYEYYQELQNQIVEDELIQQEIDAYQQYLDNQRDISFQEQEKIIEEKNPGAGTYSGWKYDRFVDNLDSDVKEIFVNQLNYTISVFEEAQLAMEEVLENGGTMNEARQAYYEKAAIPRDLMESMSTNQIEEIGLAGVINSTNDDLELIETNNNVTNNEAIIEENYSVKTATVIELPEGVTTIYLSVNGTIIELFVNGTEISQISTTN